MSAETNPQNNCREEAESRRITIPLWVWRGIEYLVFILAIGATSSFVVLIFWVILLNMATEQIKKSQEENRQVIEKNQERILTNQNANTKRLERRLLELQAVPEKDN